MARLKVWNATTGVWEYLGAGVPLILQGAAAGTDVEYTKVSGDASNRWTLNADGSMEWGDGTGVFDVGLEPGSGFSGLLLSQLVAGSILFVVEGSTASVHVREPGDANARTMLRSDSAILFGGGSAVPDAVISRTAANELTLADGDRFRHEMFGCAVSRTATQSITGSTWTAIQFNNADATDPFGFHDPASNNTRLTVPAGCGGRYNLRLNAGFASFAATIMAFGWKLNGAANPTTEAQHWMVGNTAGGPQQTASWWDIALGVGDYIEFAVYQNNAGAQNTSAALWGSMEYASET